MSVLQRFFKDTFIYGLAIVLPRLINFLLTWLYTGVFRNEQFSENTVFYVYAAFFNVIFTYGMETAFFRFFSQHQEKEKVLATSFITLTSTTIVFGVLLFVFAQPLVDVMNINLLSYYTLISIILLETLVVLPFAYLRVTGRPIRFAIIKLVNVLIIVVLNILFLAKEFQSDTLRSYFNYSNEVQYVFTANLIAAALIFISVIPYYTQVKWQLDKTILKSLLAYGWPIMIAGVAFVINENFDKWFLDTRDPHINGAYSACYKIAVFMTLFITAFKMGAEPFFFNQAKAANAKENYARILKYFTIFGALGLLGIVTYIDLIKNLIIQNESYLFALKVVPVIITANLFLGIYNNLSIWYKLTDKTRYGMYLSILGATITIVLNLALVPIYGFMVCAYATLIAYGVMMIVSYGLGRKHYPVPYDIKRISLYLISSIGLAMLSFYQFDSNLYIGTLFLCVFLGLVFYFEKNDLKQLLKKK